VNVKTGTAAWSITMGEKKQMSLRQLVVFDPEADNRVARIRKRIIDAPLEICVERAERMTESMARHWDEPPLTRMSLALAHILENIAVIIRKDELIVGCRTSKLKGAPLFPENKISWIETDVDRFDVREVQKAAISPEERWILKTKVIPFWKAKTAEDRFTSLLPQDVSRDMETFVFTCMLEITYGIGHFTMNHDLVLSRGLSGIIRIADEKLKALDAEDRTGEKGDLYRAMIRSLNAAIGFACRYADLAGEMAEMETDPIRKNELRTISTICRRVPEHPATGFHEAVQSLYFIHLIAQIESGGNSISLGRIDQILYPYYKSDLEKGLINEDQARDLLSMLFLKTNEIWNVLEEAYVPGGEGPEGKTTQNTTVGGMDRTGRDGTNELSFIALDAYAAIRTVQPNFGVRISPVSDERLFRKAVAYARDGVLLHFFNDRIIVTSLVEAGCDLSDARDYGVVGCLEPNPGGKSFGSTFAVQFNGLKCLELALNNGRDALWGQASGPETGDPASFGAFEDVWNAYDAQVIHFMNQMVKAVACLDQAIAGVVPSPFASAMIEGPLEKGRDLTAGGAVYNSTGVQLIGFSNIADSLYAVRRAVFEEKQCTLPELCGWLARNWGDAPEKQAGFSNDIPKYGNDVDDVDAVAAKVLTHFCDACSRYRNYRGGAFWPGVFSVGFHIAMGAMTGATPDGRFAGEILGNGITPSNSTSRKGPTAIMNSVAKLPLKRACNGLNLNMRFDGKTIKDSALEAMIRVYFQSGGVQIQFNMVDGPTLRKAQQEPEHYPDLIVRVSGYSATFVHLSHTAQDEIIKRTQYELS
jgi:pyruvate formate-lyase/glycerol dehydratase family glycyl radical enzyme